MPIIEIISRSSNYYNWLDREGSLSPRVMNPTLNCIHLVGYLSKNP